jgi:hypothetical protein
MPSVVAFHTERREQVFVQRVGVTRAPRSCQGFAEHRDAEIRIGNGAPHGRARTVRSESFDQRDAIESGIGIIRIDRFSHVRR